MKTNRSDIDVREWWNNYFLKSDVRFFNLLIRYFEMLPNSLWLYLTFKTLFLVFWKTFQVAWQFSILFLSFKILCKPMQGPRLLRSSSCLQRSAPVVAWFSRQYRHCAVNPIFPTIPWPAARFSITTSLTTRSPPSPLRSVSDCL